MEEIWIIGAGRFGSLACRRLFRTKKIPHLVLVDTIKKNLSRCEGPSITLELADGVAFLHERLGQGKAPDWIIPALPVHLAAEWLLLRLGPQRLLRGPLPPDLDPLLPNPIRGKGGNIYTSHADFRCPDDCVEPRDICTVTKRPRQKDMFRVLEELRLAPFRSIVIRSHQLGPGVGGYRASQLFEILARVEQAKGRILVGTACRCHGVMTGLERP